MGIKPFVATAIACAAASGAAWPTALNWMPIADILRDREVVLMHSVAGTAAEFGGNGTHSGSFLMGLGDRLEVGFDTDYKRGYSLNAKLLLYEEPTEGRYALSAGVLNFAGTEFDEYVVARYDFPQFRFHAGWMYDTDSRLLLGVDFPMFGDWSGMVEHVSGEDGYTYLGLYGYVKGVEGLSFGACVGLPNDDDNEVVYNGYVMLSFRL